MERPRVECQEGDKTLHRKRGVDDMTADAQLES
jgi:hypothetical protein